MKIEKKKKLENANWNTSAKRGLAVLMGMAAAGLIACDDTSSASSTEPEPVNPQEGVIQPVENPESSTSQKTQSSESQTTQSSVSQTTQSSVSETENLSSSQVVVDIPKSSSSFDMSLFSSSSIDEIQPLAGDPIVVLDEPSSSSESGSVESSSSETTGPDKQVTPPPLDDYNSYIRICPDLNNPACLPASMVTTFESTDIIV